MILSIYSFSHICYQLQASFDGFRLVLIGDIHELPMLHLETQAFSVTAKDWSSEVSFIVVISTGKI